MLMICIWVNVYIPGGPMTVHNLPAAINVHCVPAMVDGATGDWGTRPVIHPLGPARDRHTVQACKTEGKTNVIHLSSISAGRAPPPTWKSNRCGKV